MPSNDQALARHTVKIVAGDAAANPVILNGKAVEDPNNLGTFTIGNVAIKTPGGAVAWLFNGTRWNVIAST